MMELSTFCWVCDAPMGSLVNNSHQDCTDSKWFGWWNDTKNCHENRGGDRFFFFISIHIFSSPYAKEEQ